MNRLESWLLHISTIVLAITGLAYAWMRYMMQPQDPFSVVNHPLEPHMLSIHILIAPLLLLAFGLILHGHILYKIAAGARTARRSGFVLIPAFAVMVISGYLLQVITSDFRKILVVTHLGTGIIWSLFYTAHQIASLAQRRARQYEKRARFPVQIVVLAVLLSTSNGLQAEPFERQVHTMGTTLRLVMLENDEQKAVRNSEAVIRVIEEADNQLSTWKAKSEVSLLNRAAPGVPVRVSSNLFTLIKQIKQWSVFTGGSFDPGIGRLIDAWGVHANFRTPSQIEISTALVQSGLCHIAMDDKNLTVTKSRDIWIDPGAFGKGEGLDRALQLAASKKMGPVMLDFGGQIAVYRVPEVEKQWSAFFANPDDRFSTQDEKLSLKSGSLSTSGSSERSGISGGRTVNHILNPATGQPVEPFGSVTVWHSKALIADILSTALYVMGPGPGYSWAVKNNIAAAFIVNHQVFKTPEFVREFGS